MHHHAVAAFVVVMGVACGRGREAQTGEPGGQPLGDAVAAAESVSPSPSGAPDTSSRRAREPVTMSAPGDTAVQGVVRAVGAVPTAQIVIHSGSGTSATRVAVAGPLRAELGNLVGTEVRVWGQAVPNQPPPPSRAVEVSGYEIVSVNGRNPYVGILERRGEEMWLNSEKIVKLAAIPPGLAAASGAKVWILGLMRGGELSVDSYGVIKAR